MRQARLASFGCVLLFGSAFLAYGSVLTCGGGLCGGGASLRSRHASGLVIVHMKGTGLVSRGMAKGVAIREGNWVIEREGSKGGVSVRVGVAWAKLARDAGVKVVVAMARARGVKKGNVRRKGGYVAAARVGVGWHRVVVWVVG